MARGSRRASTSSRGSQGGSRASSGRTSRFRTSTSSRSNQGDSTASPAQVAHRSPVPHRMLNGRGANRARRRSSTATAGTGRGDNSRAGPIFGGRQNRMMALAHSRGRAYRVGGANLDESVDSPSARSTRSNRTIVLTSDEEDDDDEEGDDVDDDVDTSLEELNSDEFEELDSDELLDEYEDSFIDDGGVVRPMDSDDESESESEDEEAAGGGGGLADETFSREIAQFERMEQQQQAALTREERRRLKAEETANKENEKNALRTDMFGACTVCADEEVVDPVGCLHCASFIGCRRCARRWYTESKRNNDNKFACCPLCRAEWHGPAPEVGEMLDLIKTA